MLSVRTGGRGRPATTTRTNVVLDDRLVREAMRLSGCQTKRAAIDLALRDLVRGLRQRVVLDLAGKVHWEGDLDELRRDRF